MFTYDKWLLPEGIDEIYSDEAESLELLGRNVIDLFSSWGYRLVMPPLIEFLDSLLVGTGHDLDLQTFKLIDQVSGRLMGIRADMTPQVARIDARTTLNDLPTRLCYLGAVLRTQADHLEKSRSPMQLGAELFGHGGHASDLEIIRLMLEMLSVVGLTDVHLDLGHVGIYRGLAQQVGLNREQEAEIFGILQNKDRYELNRFLADSHISVPASEMFLALLDLNGPPSIVETAKERLRMAGESVGQAISDLKSIADSLRGLFPLLPINFDLAELRGYHYQTGVVFAAFVPGYGREVARGGRYDDIGLVFGRARLATGFSADLKVLQKLAATRQNARLRSCIFAPSNFDSDLYEMIRGLRAAGNTVIQELPGQAGTANEMGCNFEIRLIGARWTVCRV